MDLINQHTTMIHESIYSSTAVGAGVIYQELADAAFSTLDTRSRSVQSWSFTVDVHKINGMWLVTTSFVSSCIRQCWWKCFFFLINCYEGAVQSQVCLASFLGYIFCVCLYEDLLLLVLVSVVRLVSSLYWSYWLFHWEKCEVRMCTVPMLQRIVYLSI